ADVDDLADGGRAGRRRLEEPHDRIDDAAQRDRAQHADQPLQETAPRHGLPPGMEQMVRPRRPLRRGRVWHFELKAGLAVNVSPPGTVANQYDAPEKSGSVLSSRRD